MDCVQPKCTELRRLVQKLEVMLGEKRRILHKFLDLIDGIEAANKWSTSALSHLSRQEDPRSSLTDEDVSTFQRPENLASNFSWLFFLQNANSKIGTQPEKTREKTPKPKSQNFVRVRVLLLGTQSSL